MTDDSFEQQMAMFGAVERRGINRSVQLKLLLINKLIITVKERPQASNN